MNEVLRELRIGNAALWVVPDGDSGWWQAQLGIPGPAGEGWLVAYDSIAPPIGRSPELMRQTMRVRVNYMAERLRSELAKAQALQGSE